ncbi:MAG TPA: hypothetical protein VN260_06265 [Dissulfurispiraceae bacterium]|nr:hypothetical protein [Dissulfurispiraceae bacterium]
MPKVSVEKLEPGMTLSRPVKNEAGMVLIGEGTVMSDQLIEKLKRMGISSVFVEGASMPEKPKEEMIRELNERFKKTEREPQMSLLKRLFREHIEALYA